MDTKRAGTAILVLLAILAVLYVLTTYSFSSTKHGETMGDLTISHNVQNGMHNYKGTVILDTACETLAAAVSVAFVEPPKATIKLTTTKPANVSCPQIETRNDFDVEVSGGADPEVEVSLNGKPVAVSIVEQ